MALKILLVDPDYKWLEKGKAYLEDQLYEVDTEENGKGAQLSIYNKPFFGIVINHSTKNHPALQVLKFIKTNYTGMTIIYVFDTKGQMESDGLDEAKLKKMGVTEVWTKSDDLDELKKCVRNYREKKANI